MALAAEGLNPQGLKARNLYGDAGGWAGALPLTSAIMMRISVRDIRRSIDGKQHKWWRPLRLIPANLAGNSETRRTAPWPRPRREAELSVRLAGTRLQGAIISAASARDLADSTLDPARRSRRRISARIMGIKRWRRNPSRGKESQELAT